MEMIICDCNLMESRMIETSVLEYYKVKDVPVLIYHCSNWQELSCQLKEKPVDTIIVALDGVNGLDIITGLKIPSGRLIWFSDLDFGIQAYRLGITYFNKKPITQEKVTHALKMLEVK